MEIIEIVVLVLVGAAACLTIQAFVAHHIQDRGYGRCGRCHGSWRTHDSHTTWYNEDGGCFPLCERCWKALGTPEARLPYYEELWEEWGAESPDYTPSSKWDQIEAAVRNGD